MFGFKAKVSPVASHDAARVHGVERQKFRAGDRVVVRSAQEILSTLDADGTLHGLPFMPEMLEWCGKPYTIQRRAEKTCVDVSPESGINPHRRFAGDDVVFLDGPRCGGQGHDGCKRACKMFWKEDWLRAFDPADSSAHASESGLDVHLPRLKTKVEADRYFCQSTQLFTATEAFPGKMKPWILRIIVREIRNGDRSVLEILQLLVLWAWRRLIRVATGRAWVRGPNERITPSVSLGLEPGEIVRFKSSADMVATLNHKGKNRGMGFCAEMTRFCGGQAEVMHRCDRIINERTGKMREIKDTVTLKNMRTATPLLPNSECLCFDVLGDCARGDPMMWREIWLTRASASSGN